MSQILIVAAAFIGAFAPPAEKAPPPRPAAEKFTFKMKNVPWDEVLEWYSKESGLTPIYNVRPTGKFTFIPPTPDAKYTLAEITDIINEAVASQKLFLLPRRVSYTIIPTDEKLDVGPIPRYELSNVEKLPKTQFVQLLIPLTSIAVGELLPEVRKLLTPYGEVSTLTKTNTLVVFDTAGNLRRIVKIIEDAEGSAKNYCFHHCRWKGAQDIADELKVLLTDKDSQVQLYGSHPCGAQDDDPYGRKGFQFPHYFDPYGRNNSYSAWDPRAWGNITSITVDANANNLIVTGPPQKIALAKKIIEEKDRLPPGVIVDFFDEPELRKYSVAACTADAAAKAVMADFPKLRAIAVPRANEILVLAEPDEHKLVAEFVKAINEKKLEQKRFTVQFKSVPWADVLAWYAKETGLKDVSTAKPEGNVTIRPPKDRQFTLGEVSDLLNEALTQQKLILIRGEKSFAVVPTDAKIDPKLIPRIELTELPHRGKTEMVQVLIPLGSLAVEDTAPEVQKMLTPFGTVSMIRFFNMLVVTDTAGNVNRIYQTLQDCENCDQSDNLCCYRCKWKKAQDVADMVKVLLVLWGTESSTQPQQPYYDPYGRGGDPRDPYPRRYGGATGRIKAISITVDAKANTLYITGPPDKLVLVRKLVTAIDKPSSTKDKPLTPNEPELRKYSVPAGSADAVAKALLAESPNLRVIALPATDEILVLATPEEHFLIRSACPKCSSATTTETEVIPVNGGDLEEIAIKLAKLFPSAAGGPIIEAQISGQPGIIVRGTPEQIEKVRDALKGCTDENPEKKFTIYFKRVPWADALAWYARESGLKDTSNVKLMEKVTIMPPKDRQFTLGEVTDLINEALRFEKLILIRDETSFAVVPTDLGVDPSLVPAIKVGDLTQRGNTELVQVKLTLKSPNAEELVPELKKLLGPLGIIAALPKGKVVVLDTVGNVRRMIEVLRAIDEKKPADEPKRFSFKMKVAQWEDVLDWYQKETGLTPIYNMHPTGAFTFVPPKPDMKYTLTEITDIINDGMAAQKYRLVRNNVTFTIVEVGEKLDPMRIPHADLSDLPKLGKTELVQALIPLNGLDAKEAAPQVRKMLTPYGSVTAIGKANLLLVTDDAAYISRIAAELQRRENALANEWEPTYRCKHKKAEDVAARVKTILSDADVADQGKAVLLAVDAKTNTITVTAPPARMARVMKLITEVDSSIGLYHEPHRFEELEIRWYSAPEDTARDVANKLEADSPTLSVYVLRARDQVIVTATPKEHAAILRKYKDITPSKKPEEKK